MAKDRHYIFGEVLETLPATRFKVKLDDGREVICTLCGRLWRNNIRVIVADRVGVVLSPDGRIGRIEIRRK